MVSQIDPTVPVFGSPTTASVRANFLTAKNEITALQNAVAITLPLPVASGGTGATTTAAALTSLGAVPLAGGTMTGLLLLSGPPTNNLGAATKAYVDGNFPVSVANGGTGANNSTTALANLGGATTASPTFTGIPQAPTAPTGDSSTIIATTAFVHNVISSMPVPITAVNSGTGITVNTAGGIATVNLTVPVSVANGGTGAGTATAGLTNLGGAPLASPVFTGVPAAPTPPPGTNTTQLATTAFVVAALGAGSGVTSVVGANGGGILVNGSTGTPAGGAVTLSLLAPVSITNGGTGATTSNGAFDSLLGGISSGSGFITRQTGGSYALTAATLTPVNRTLIINASNAISTSSIMSDNGTTIGIAAAGNMVMGGPVPGTPTQTLAINQNTVAPPAATYATNINLAGADNALAGMEATTYGSNPVVFSARRTRGTAAAPTAVQANDVLCTWRASGWGTGFSNLNGIGELGVLATENWTGTAQGTAINLASTVIGSLTEVTSLQLKGNTQRMSGGLMIGAANTIFAIADAVIGNGTLTLNANTVAPQPGQTGNLMIVGSDGSNVTAVLDSYGTGSNIFASRHARGTGVAPTAVQSGDLLLLLAGTGYAATGYGTFANPSIWLEAAENFTATNQGTRIRLTSSPLGTTSDVNSLILQGNTATFSGNVTLPVSSALNIGTGNIFCDGATMAFHLPSGNNAWGFYNPSAVVVSSIDGSGNFATHGATHTFGIAGGSNSCAVNVEGGPAADAALLVHATKQWKFSSQGFSSAGDLWIFDATASVNRIQLATGGANNVSAAWGIISDASMKSDVAPLPHGLAEIMQLNPCSFTYKDSGLPGTGLIAQEVEAIMPDLVRDMPTDDSGGSAKAVVETGIIWPLVNACKELAAANEELRQRLVALEAQMRHAAPAAAPMQTQTTRPRR